MSCVHDASSLPCFVDTHTALGSQDSAYETWSEDPKFVEVSASVIRDATWQHVYSGRYQRVEPIHLKESRASLWTLRRFCKGLSTRRKRLLVLGDNMSAVLAHGKGRASDWHLLVQCRRRAALCVARRLVVVER